MGKRKPSFDRNKRNRNRHEPPSMSADMPCSSGKKYLASEKPSRLVEASGLKLTSHGTDDIKDTTKPLNVCSSQTMSNYNLCSSILMKRSRHSSGHQYSRRKTVVHSNESTSYGNVSPFADERLISKFVDFRNPQSEFHTDNGDEVYSMLERIRSSSVASDSMSSVCVICEKGLDVYSVVAILVCGHAYHADCFEEKTSFKDRRDPPCILCSSDMPTEANAQVDEHVHM